MRGPERTLNRLATAEPSHTAAAAAPTSLAAGFDGPPSDEWRCPLATRLAPGLPDQQTAHRDDGWPPRAPAFGGVCLRVRRRHGALWSGFVSDGEERLCAASVGAHGRVTSCGLVELREHVLERIPEDLGADHLDAGIEEQLAKGGEEDRGINAGRTAELANAIGEGIAHVADGGQASA
jgi:hypothetical protein